MRTEDFSFFLPEELIAQQPPSIRGDSRLLFVNRQQKNWQHRKFSEITEIFGPGDILVFNQSQVIPARIKLPGKSEIFICEQLTNSENTSCWSCLVRPGKKFRPGAQINFEDGTIATVKKVLTSGLREIEFSTTADFWSFIERFGSIPLPPYIERQTNDSDLERYQTIYAKERGSVAAPTAGLHFSEQILQELSKNGVQMEFVTLHVGLGTFLPIKTEKIEDHKMHQELFEISAETASNINHGKQAGKKITAIGSTSLRTIESACDDNGALVAGTGKTDIFLYPPATFRITDHFFTNFHLPKSTLLMLTAAFASPGKTDGRELMLDVYRSAVEERYRFFSYGDASLLW